jgi:beta-N-acetylhexosaminidase
MSGSSTEGLDRLAAATLLASYHGPVVPGWLVRRVDQGLGGVCLFGSNLARGTGSPAAAGAAATPSPAHAHRASADGHTGVGASGGGTDDQAHVGEPDAGVIAAARVSATLHAARPSVVVALDEEGGDVTRIEAHIGSSVPGNAALGAVDDAALTRRLAHDLGLRLVEAGVDLDLAPCADANVDPANPVIGVRSFGAEPTRVARHVAAFVEGLQTAGVAACAKHFPGHGATTVDSHLDLPVVDAPADVLRTRELVPFRAAIAAGAATVMLGHLRMPAFDDQPATVSHRIVTGLLRDELGFEGAAVTDALDMRGIGGARAIPANVVRAVAAGVDLCCLGSDATDELIGACIDALVAAVHSGALSEARLADAAGRVATISRGRPDEEALGQSEVPARRSELRRSVPPDDPAQALRAVFSSPADLGAEAARRALVVDGDLAGPIGPAHVVELRSTPNIAAGVVPWGVAAPLTDLAPDTTSEQIDPGGSDDDGTTPLVSPTLERAQGRRLVVVVRDAQRRSATAEVVRALVAARPDAVVVDMGWPAESQIAVRPAGVHISTFGASRVSGEAVARLLAACDAPAAPASSASKAGRSGCG